MSLQVLITDESIKVLHEVRLIIPVMQQLTMSKMTDQQTHVMGAILDQLARYDGGWETGVGDKGCETGYETGVGWDIRGGRQVVEDGGGTQEWATVGR